MTTLDYLFIYVFIRDISFGTQLVQIYGFAFHIILE